MISSQETRKEKFMGKEIVGLPKSRHTNFSSKFSTFQHPHFNVKNKRLSFYFIFKGFQIAFLLCSCNLQSHSLLQSVSDLEEGKVDLIIYPR